MCKHTISYHVIPFIDQLKEENQNCIPINWRSIRCYARVSNNIKIWQGLQRVILISLVCLFLLFRAIWSMKNLHWRFIFDAQSSLRTAIWPWRGKFSIFFLNIPVLLLFCPLNKDCIRKLNLAIKINLLWKYRYLFYSLVHMCINIHAQKDGGVDWCL